MNLVESIKKFKNIGNITLKNYMRILSRFSKEIGIKDEEILLNSNLKILQIIKKYKITSQATLLSAMITAMSSFQEYNEPDYTKSIETYRKYMQTLLPTIQDQKYSQIKNETQEINWCTWEDLQKCIGINRKKITKLLKRDNLDFKDLKLIQLWLISSIYCSSDLNPPRRLDYKNIIIINKKDYELEHLENQNYLIVESAQKKYFLFQNFKTVKTFGKVSIPVSKILNKHINEYLKMLVLNNINAKYLFFNNKDQAIEAGLSILIGEAFEPTGKNITVNLIRHIYLSKNADDWTLAQRRETSRLMSHSIETQLTYSKIDSDSD
mgnify:CR=1 FL=1